MIDKEHLEQTGLYALGLLEEHERTRFEQELRVNAHLREALRDISAHTAAISLSVPQVPAPAGALAKIEKRLGLTAGRAPRFAGLPGMRRLRISPAWGAAAAFALLAGGLGVSSWRSSQRLAELEDRLVRLDGPSGRQTTPALTPDGDSTPDKTSAQPGTGDADDPAHRDRPRFIGSRTLRSMKLPADVERDLARLRAMEQDRQDRAEPPAGIADLRIMEMYPPGVTPPARKERALLAARVAEAVNAALKTGESSPETPPDPSKQGTEQTKAEPDKEPVKETVKPAAPQPPVLKGQGSSPNADIVIREGGTVNIPALNLHPDAHVVHENFPADAEFQRYGLVRLDDTRVWDGNGGIWHHKGGNTYVGQKAPTEFQPPDPDDPVIVTIPPLRDAPQQPAPPVQPPFPAPVEPKTPTAPAGTGAETLVATAPASALPYALPLIGSDGKGMIVTRNLAVPPEGSGYALWSTSSVDGSASLVGFLPADAVNGVFAFDLPAGTSAPAGFRITTQTFNQTATPGVSILQGP